MKVIKPTFLINKDQCRKNIAKISSKAQKYKLQFRPHFKTHQSAEIGKLYSEAGITKITVSSIDMAMYFMNNGWQDITIAFPVNVLEIDVINTMAKNIRLNLLVLDEHSITFLDENLKSNVNIFIKIDTGYHRSGIDYQNTSKIDELISLISDSEKMNFNGFLTHAGHTYNATSVDEILNIHDQTICRMKKLKSHFNIHNPMISTGNTPSCSLSENFEGVDEIRPGNFVYYDLTQNYLGSCSEDEISVALACPIVDINAERNEVIIYGGGVHLSKEYLEIDGDKIFGKVVILKDCGWSNSLDNCFVKKLSQEHGTLHITDEYIDIFNIGDIIGILPIHSCMTANLLKENTVII